MHVHGISIYYWIIAIIIIEFSYIIKENDHIFQVINH